MELELRINGVIESQDVAANETLLSMLRREGHCSVKQGCETGECGACTVLVDGVPRPSCVMLAAQAGGCTITTAEGLGTAPNLHPLQQAFIEVGAAQCGFCTSGMLLAASALLKRNNRPTEAEVRDALSGNLCRCNGYARPVQAVLRAAALLRGETVPSVEQNVITNQEMTLLSITGKSRAVTANGMAGTTTKIPVISTGAAGLLDPQLEVIGKSVYNIDTVKFVTGQSSFAADISPRGLLYGRVLTSPHAHAVIRDIDVSEAKALPGVLAVLTHRDMPRTPYAGAEHTTHDNSPADQYILDYIVRYVGDRVAVIAAETPEVAEQALSLISVDYEVLPAILDPRQAREANAPRLHPESESLHIYDAARNIAARVRSEIGDVERGFAEADLVVEDEYVLPTTQPVPLEKHTVVTYFDEDNHLVVRTSTQAPHHIRRTLARLLDLPIRRIRVIKPDVGGGFGTKQEIVLEDLCALLTIATKRPVMLAYSRAEEFSSSRLRHQHIIRLKTGVQHDGTIVANQMVFLTSTGAHATHPLAIQNGAIAEILALYPCPNVRYIAEVMYTNLPPAAASRGYGTLAESFALEVHMDEIAKRLHMDALAFRRRNWLKVGDDYLWQKSLSKGKESTLQITSCGLLDCLRIVEEKLSWHTKRGRVGNGRNRSGVGIALSLHGHPAMTTGASGAMIKLNEDGSFDIFMGASDGSSEAHTLLAQIAAETLGVLIECIILHTSQTDTMPTEIGENATAALYLSGGAVKRAAEQIRRQVLAVAGRMLNVLPEALKISNGIITSPTGQTVTMEQVAQHSLYVESRHIMTTASWKMPYMPTTFAAQGVEVEVDIETGCVRILKAIVAVDAGRVLNPAIEEGQVQGSIAQGLGHSLSEELLFDQNGRILTTNLVDYHIFGATDMPEMQVYMVETNEPAGPFGAKAVAEAPLQGIIPAVANAVSDALGIRLRQIPLTPERVLRAIHSQPAK